MDVKTCRTIYMRSNVLTYRTIDMWSNVFTYKTISSQKWFIAKSISCLDLGTLEECNPSHQVPPIYPHFPMKPWVCWILSSPWNDTHMQLDPSEQSRQAGA